VRDGVVAEIARLGEAQKIVGPILYVPWTSDRRPPRPMTAGAAEPARRKSSAAMSRYCHTHW
jgi:hypothetical protein